jgi:peptide-methionine (R)-S-oxide reductase
MADKINKTDAQWRAELTPEQYQVLREHGTERAGTSPLNEEKASGMYNYAPTSPDAVSEHVDKSWFSTRTEVRCANCEGHLGHVFPDGPNPTGLRYCMNGAALKFNPDKA